MIRRTDKGFSLIEVIVSMLILAIIVVPLLSNFVLSSRVNLKSRIKQYATTLAQSTMESLKSFDLEEVALQMNGITEFKVIPNENLGMDTYGNGFYETNESFEPILIHGPGAIDFSRVSVSSNLPDAKFTTKTEKKYYYAINQVKEGTKEFDLHITYDGSNYPGNQSDMSVNEEDRVSQNQYVIPNITNLDIKETALINPNGSNIEFQVIGEQYVYDSSNDSFLLSSDVSFDTRAVNYFKVKHIEYINAKNSSIRLENDTHKDDPGYVMQPELLVENIDVIRKHIKRQTLITIRNDGVKDKVSCKLIYTFLNPGKLLCDEGNEFTILPKEYAGFFHDISFDTLSNIYLFHTPLLVGQEWAGDPSDSIVIDCQTTISNRLNVYVAEQTPDGNFAQNRKIVVDIKGLDNDKIWLFTNNDKYEALDISKSAYIQTHVNSGIVTDGDKKERIYDVTVAVYERGTNHLLYELTSTVVR